MRLSLCVSLENDIEEGDSAKDVRATYRELSRHVDDLAAN